MFFIKAYNHKRKFSVTALIAILLQIFSPLQTFALTGGPSQSEYESFEPAGASEMVNMATGDFVYNIPLMDVDGYPINIAYHAGVTMEQEATWVGLGWNLNVGSVSRAMRGLPDDFDGDVVQEEINIKKQKEYGVDLGLGVELIGIDLANLLNLGSNLQMGFGISYNNYKGLGLSVELGITGDLSAGTLGVSGSIGGGLGIKISNSDGADFTMDGSLGGQLGLAKCSSIGKNYLKGWNSRQGMTAEIVSGSTAKGVGIGGLSYMSGTGQSINLIQNTAYMPTLEYSTQFMGLTGEIHVGGELFWCNGYGYLRGHYFEQSLTDTKYSRPAYGYLNLQNAGDNAMMDFNRDKDGTYYLECPKLPFATLTYDLFNTNAQGLNEVYRPYRNDFGHVHDNLITGGGVANDIGLEVMIGNLFEAGVNDYSVETYNTSGDWVNNNNATDNKFQGDNQLTNNGSDQYNATYFTALDEMIEEDMSLFGGVGGEKLTQFDITQGPGATLLNTLVFPGSGSYSGQRRIRRDVQANNFSFITTQEARAVSPTNTTSNKTNVISFPANTFTYTSSGDVDPSASGTTSLPRDLGIGNIEGRISEISVVKDDGARYVYGIPVYNRTYNEAVFNCAGNTVTDNDVVDYTSGDKSLSNSKGKDNFYNSKSLPPYAHSYVLTALLSKDYVDITGNGMTQDDYGDYTKFNYTQVTSNYEWRNPVPVNPTQALYDPVLRADPDDDKAAVVSGSKELWYLHSIETKNYVAEFHTSDRLDGLGCDVDGNILSNASNTPKRLDKIVLYCKHDLTTPVKTVFFEYDYSLCPGTINSNGGGKLTLKKVYFTYGTSDKSVFNPYLFTYSSFNPGYDRRWMDRWGYYQTATGNFTDNNKDFPYTSQDAATVNNNATAWTLNSIITPSKSQINVYYEADSYAYIQDKTPGQMLTMMEFTNSNPGSGYTPTVPNNSTTSDLYNTSSPYSPNNWMIIDLTLLAGGGLEAANQSDADTKFRTKVLPLTNSNGKDQMYFRGIVRIGPNAGQEELIPGYAEFDRQSSAVIATNSSSLPNGNTLYKYAYVKLKDVDIEDPVNYAGNNCNPVSKAGWQITRLLHPKIAYPGSEPTGVISALAGLWAALTEVFTFRQKNQRLRKKGYSSKIFPAKSVVRVNVPTRAKFGGGHRVNRIEILDNWNNSVASENSTMFGQTYDYTIKDNNEIITSGVASYEPTVGNDEISLREPVEYSVGHIAAPDDAHFFERPVGEAFFPPPTVIYRKITVKNLDRLDGSGNFITQNLGRTEYEFYTSKDFPLSSSMNEMTTNIRYPDPQGDLFSPTMETSANLSQGFLLKLNNMHGKLKSILSFQEGNNLPISGNKYFYKTNTNTKQLNNTIDVMGQGAVVSSKMVGEHVEAVSDMRSSSSITFGKNFRLNLNVSTLILPIPIPIPSWFHGNSSETRDFQSSSFSKIITQNGILNKIENIDNYATYTTEHLIWDEVTNEPILSRTTTKFKDYDYTFSKRAYYVYKGMSGSYQNIGYGFKDKVATSNGVVSAGSLIKDGDEVELIYTDANDQILGIYPDRLWISKPSTSYLLIDRTGKTCGTGTGMNNVYASSVQPAGTAHHVIKIIRSGYRNNLHDVAETISGLDNTVYNSDMVLEASATEYSEDWPAPCNYPYVTCADMSFASTNPYILNSKGNWNAKRSYTYLTSRKEKDASGKYNIRATGTFNDFVPFFSGTTPIYDPSRATYTASVPFINWVMNSEITGVNANGHIIEGKDGLNRFSAALYGYNQTLKTAQAVNARYREIGSTNLEDNNFPGFCLDRHFFLNGSYSVTNAVAHTGRYAGQLNFEQTVYYNLTPTDVNCTLPYGLNNIYIDPATSATTSAVYGFSNTTTCVKCVSDVSPFIKYPQPQTYIFSLWLKEGSASATGDYTIPQVLILSGPATITQTSKSQIIDGWQKWDYEVTVAANIGSSVLLAIRNMTNGATVYFDDVRFYPKNAAMSTYVYDPVTLRLWAELDAQNFATFYTYNNEGILIGTKKETERGILSIKETRNSFKKN